MPQYLLIFEQGTKAGESLTAVNGLRVVSFYANRLAIVETDQGIAEISSLLPGIEILAGSTPVPSTVRLASDEALFVSAWQASQNLQNKKRIGEGLPWGAEGFQPPDRPRKP